MALHGAIFGAAKVHRESVVPTLPRWPGAASTSGREAELKAEWIEPELLAPAFAHIATTREAALSGQRLNAWDLSQEHPL